MKTLVCMFMMFQSLQFFPPDSEKIVYMGRFETSNQNQYIASFSSSSISFSVDSRVVEIVVTDYALDSSQPNFLEVIVDSVVHKTLQLQPGKQTYRIFESHDKIQRNFTIVKRTEGQIGSIGFGGVYVEKQAQFYTMPKSDVRLLFIGNSITCGYGNEALHAEEVFSSATENAYMSYAAIAARDLHADYHTIAYSGKGIYRNYGDTVFLQDCMPQVFQRTFALTPSPQWNHADFIPHVVVINLGTNDFSPPLGADKETYCTYYKQFITDLYALYPSTHIVLASSQMLDGEQRTLQLIWLHEIAGYFQDQSIRVCELSQQGSVGFGADWHPNIAQNKINAQELVRCIRGLL